MTNSQFNLAEKAWAEKILDEPSYTMANGRQSHDVAYGVLSAVMDRMIDENHLNAAGQWTVRT